MSDIILRQGETTQITIELDEALGEGMILYFTIAKNKRVLLSGNTKDGKIEKIDDLHYVVNLTSDDTFNLALCELELAYGLEGRVVVNICESAIPLEFTYNNIKHTLI